MKTRDATKILKKGGWTTHRDEVGDSYTIFRLPDRIVEIIYRVRTYRDEQEFEGMLSVSTEAFSQAAAAVRKKKPSQEVLVLANPGLSIKAPEILEHHMHRACAEALGWARQQDLDKALVDYSKLPTDSPGSFPVRHLAALAVLGDVARLTHYRDCFVAGDRLGFVPYVTQDYIDRALDLARQNASTA